MRKHKSKIQFSTPKQQENKKISDETRENFKFEITTNISSKAVFKKETQGNFQFLTTIAFWSSIIFGLGTFVVLNAFQAQTLSIILGIITLLSILYLAWNFISLNIFENMFLSQLKKTLKKNNLHIFLDEDKNEPFSKETQTKALKRLMLILNGKNSAYVGFITDQNSNISDARYTVIAREADNQMILVFTPSNTESKNIIQNKENDWEDNNLLIVVLETLAAVFR